ncbi:MAG: DUF504 domain-containing protein [Gammaproteobacteria bacterium]
MPQTPIQDMLNRIRWDPDYGRAEFVIGYYDRILDRVVTVPLREITFPADSHFVFELTDDEGRVHSIPLHRVRDIHRNGELIWHREPH